MPWKVINPMDAKTEFVLRAMRQDSDFGRLCGEFGISRKTGYKWKERFLRDGLSGLAERSRRPVQSPNQLGEDHVCRIVRLKQAHPHWGPRNCASSLLGNRAGSWCRQRARLSGSWTRRAWSSTVASGEVRTRVPG